GGVDTKCTRVMLAAGDARAAVARGDVEGAPRRMRPGILDLRGQRQRASPLERCAIDVDTVEREIGPGARIEHRLGFAGLGERGFRKSGRCDAPGEKACECPTIDHELSSWFWHAGFCRDGFEIRPCTVREPHNPNTNTIVALARFFSSGMRASLLRA